MHIVGYVSSVNSMNICMDAERIACTALNIVSQRGEKNRENRMTDVYAIGLDLFGSTLHFKILFLTVCAL